MQLHSGVVLFSAQVIREVIDVHSGELAKLWQEEEREMEEASKRSSHR